MVETATGSIPPEILEAYYPDGVIHTEPIKGGEVNTTWLVINTGEEKTVLQRLSPMYTAAVGRDYEVVAAHLRRDGWEMATPRTAANDTAYLPDTNGRLWRAFDYLESVPGSYLEGNLNAGVALGGLLGALHGSLATLDYEPEFAQPHSQDVDYYVERLTTLTPQLPPTERQLATTMIAGAQADTIADEPAQLIHSDPRIGNTLLRIRDSMPFTFIDWDGYRRANPLVDVGDMLQSTVGEVITKGSGKCSVTELRPMLEAYYEAAELDDNLETFIEAALAAGRVITLNLGMRHLIDAVEDDYFVWDEHRFQSRFEFNVFCARRQQQVYKVLSSSTP